MDAAFVQVRLVSPESGDVPNHHIPAHLCGHLQVPNEMNYQTHRNDFIKDLDDGDGDCTALLHTLFQ